MTKKQLLLISFIEGAAMLSVEVASGRLISVYFGGSLYVWMFVLAITLSGLAIGYFLGNLWHKKTALGNIFMALSISLCSWIFYKYIALFSMSHFGLMTCVIVQATFMLIVPMSLFGAISTMIALAYQKNVSTENAYGTVLGISTIGSIAGIFITVMMLFPALGVLFAVQIFALILFLVGLWLKVKDKRFKAATMLIISVSVLFTLSSSKQKKYLYHNEGSLSTVAVKDDTIKNLRYLLVNNIVQAIINKTAPNERQWDYLKYIEQISPKTNQPKTCLNLGLGGGILANYLVNNNYEVTSLEIDSRIIMIAKKYFKLNPKVKCINQDAKIYIEHSQNKYDLIIFDMFRAEEPPSYLLTKTTFNKLRTLLKNDSSLLIMNWYGYYTGKIAGGTHILINTLKAAGFELSFYLTNPQQDYANLVICACKDSTFLPPSNVDIKLFSDDIHYDEDFKFDFYNAIANFKWRKSYLWWIKAEN